MPELDGFGVLEGLADTLGADRLPAVVFVTAYDAYAVRAFEAGAMDYLLKPYTRGRFETALSRAVERLSRAREHGGSASDLRALLSALREEREARRSRPERFAVRSAKGTISFVRIADVDWVEADGNYVRLHAHGRSHLVRDTLKAVEARLDPSQFVRVHRSAIVNVERVVTLEPYFHGEFVVTLRDGTKLTSSRTFSDRLRALIG